MILLNGKKLSEKILNEVQQEVQSIKLSHTKNITLACILVGDDPSSIIYVNNKIKSCRKVGMLSQLHHLKESATQQELNDLINKLNNDTNVNGILLQLPLPKHLNPREAISHLSPSKDIDGLTSLNLGKLMAGEYSGLTACTAVGIMELLNEYNIDLNGKNAVIIGKSLIVGRPLVELFLNNNATVTICHRATTDLNMHTKNADIIVSAVGKKDFITGDQIKQGSILIDVGIVREGTSIYGDVNFDSVKDKAGFVTPVPGGIGPITVSMLVKNTLLAFKQQNNLE